jgi:hypothetical protein
MPHLPADLSKVTTVPLGARANRVSLQGFAVPPVAGRSAADLIAGLPDILAGRDFREVVAAIVAAHRHGRPVLVALGGHVIKCGLSPVLIDLMRRGIITGLVLTGSAAIHDCEIALIGETSEDVTAGLKDGSFGMARETGAAMNAAINQVRTRADAGMGALLGEYLEKQQAPSRGNSLLAEAHSLGLPATVHVAIGADIIHMHPNADGAATGQATMNDFRLLATLASELTGGVFVNIGSAVLIPEVFLKAFTIAQNLGAQLHDFVTVDMDMIAQYRPGENVVRRPPTVGGRGFSLIGRHEIMVPLLAQAVVDALAASGDPS